MILWCLKFVLKILETTRRNAGEFYVYDDNIVRVTSLNYKYQLVVVTNVDNKQVSTLQTAVIARKQNCITQHNPLSSYIGVEVNIIISFR